ncbi:MAG: bifunctional 2-dehydro-3-deoxygluconokinase/2-dehydro-3-deoxygalactonokinase [Haloferacaceae archaeon]
MTELVTFGETMLRLSPPPGERLETADRFDAGAGGAESNVAAAAAQLGTDAVWLSKLPDSPLGRRVARELRGHGVRTGVTWADADESRLGTYYLEYGGAPRGTEVVYDRENAAITSVTATELPTGAIRGASVFHTSGITPALSDAAAETTAALLRLAGESGTTRSFDVNYRSKLWPAETARKAYESLFEHVDVLFVPQRDATGVLGYEGDAVDVAHGLDTDFDFETVVLTRGDAGSLALHGGELHEQGTVPADTVDEIGTGDAFVGGFLSRRIRGGDVGDSLSYGAAAAALKRTVSGDVAVLTRSEVASILEDERDDVSR